MVMITSTSNSQVKDLVQLKKKAKARKQQRIYVVEGIRMFREAPVDRIKMIYVSESFLSDPEHKKLLEGETIRSIVRSGVFLCF